MKHERKKNQTIQCKLLLKNTTVAIQIVKQQQVSNNGVHDSEKEKKNRYYDSNKENIYQ